MESHVNPINGLVVLVFGNPTTALWISLFLLLWCALIIVRNYIRFHRPLSAALKQRVDALAPMLDAEDNDTAQRLFADQFYEIDAAMTAGGRTAHELRQAWSQFRETILDESQVPMGADSARRKGPTSIGSMFRSSFPRLASEWVNCRLGVPRPTTISSLSTRGN